VEYEVTLINKGGTVLVDNPARLPAIAEIESIAEPWVRVDVVTPTSYIGPLMELATGRRGTFENMEYLDPSAC
jgi:GTP-binding protein LepA